MNPDAYGAARHWYSLRIAGLSLYGGIAGAAVVLAVTARLLRIRLLPVLDAAVFPFVPAFCIARLGCFLNGCCGGIRTAMPWGVAFPSGRIDLVGLLSLEAPKVHPTQLYELALTAAGFPLCRRLARKHPVPGLLFFSFSAWFHALRLLVLPLRALPYPAWVTKAAYPVLYVLCIFLAGSACRALLKKPADAVSNPTV